MSYYGEQVFCFIYRMLRSTGLLVYSIVLFIKLHLILKRFTNVFEIHETSIHFLSCMCRLCHWLLCYLRHVDILIIIVLTVVNLHAALLVYLSKLSASVALNRLRLILIRVPTLWSVEFPFMTTTNIIRR